MKRMYSEEELLEFANTENLVDSKGRNRFIVGNGTPQPVSGMTISSDKWTLNGNNLVFEILGIYSGISLSGYDILTTFDLPNWVADKIVTPVTNIVDIFTCSMVSSEDGSIIEIKIQVTKSGNTIYFTNLSNTTISDISLFKIRYNTIIDNE